jgi:hypothetical protein
LEAYASRRHILIVPEQEAFGHLHHVLQYEKYSDLAETPHGHVIAPGQPGSQPLIDSWFTQISQDFPSPFLHIGADETFELGTGRTRADVTKRGLGPVYADFLTTIHTTLAPLHRKLLFWGDVAGTDPAAIPGIPHDMIAIPWIYWHKDSYDHDILPFKQAGMETWVAPGDANWRVVYPLGNAALDNIAGFVESGQRLGSTGELTSTRIGSASSSAPPPVGNPARATPTSTARPSARSFMATPPARSTRRRPNSWPPKTSSTSAMTPFGWIPGARPV